MRSNIKYLTLSVKLFQIVKDKNDLTSLSIKEWIISKQPIEDLLKTIVSQACDNEKLIIGIITENLLADIRKTVLLLESNK